MTSQKPQYQMVPVEPTLEMFIAANSVERVSPWRDQMVLVWAAMLAAAPKSPGLPTEDELTAAIKKAIYGIPVSGGGYISCVQETLSNVVSRPLLDKISAFAARAVLSLINPRVRGE